jgi:hypothetical protein
VNHVRGYLAIATFCLLMALTAAAQDSQPNNVSPLNDPDPQEKLLTFEFKGGSGDDYVATVRKIASDANIVVMGDLSTVKVPPIRLQSVSVWSALDVLQSIPGDEQTGLRGIDVQWKMGAPQQRGMMRPTSSAPVYVVSAVTTNSGIVKSTRTMTVLEVNQMLESGIKSNDLLTAVETSMSMLKGEYEPADVRFHEQTGLLIVRGHPEQTNTVKSVIDQLSERARRIRGQKQQDVDRQELEQLRSAIKGYEHDRNQLTHELDGARHKHEMLERELIKSRERIQALELKIDSLNSGAKQPNTEKDAAAKPR